ncbi:Cytochrome P450, E-class, group I [Trema orientale]|uniref:Cytochrome P450, E-class, group I n=1 Tax=Trema orientale TaxID=63057 RepID=A0A2P5F1H5_TREOI|nr:Cytochrome P450, E-class, group I [Trema orientale]
MIAFQDYNTLLLLFLALVSTTFLLGRALYSSKAQTKPPLPPSPPALPIIGHLHLLGKLPHQALCKVSARYGPIVYLRFGYKPSLLVSSAEIAKECLKTNESCFLNRPQRANFDYLTYGNSDFSVAPYGPFWKFMRKLTVNKLLGASIMDFYRPIRREEIGVLISNLRKLANDGEKVDVGAQLMGLTNNVISRMALKQKCAKNDDDAYEMRHVVDEMCDLAGKLNVQDFIWFCRKLDLQRFGKRLREVRGRYDRLMGRIIEDHEQAKRKRKESKCADDEEVKDILDMLLDEFEDEKSEIKLTKENIHAYVMNIFGAGTETQSVTMEWALSELLTHPTAMAKARQEIKQVVGTNRIVEESDLPNLPYVRAVIKETLRLHPGGPFIARESSKDCNIAGYHVPANTRLFLNTWAINRDPTHWDDPHRFIPERFMEEKKDVDVRGQNFEVLPFGSGRRGCPGVNLALLVVPTTVAALVQCFDWNGVVDMEEGFGLSLPRAKPLNFEVLPFRSGRRGCPGFNLALLVVPTMVAALVQCFDWKVGEDKNDVVDMEEGFGLSLPRAKPLVCFPVVRLDPFLRICDTL